ncbi:MULTISPECIES: zinc-binding dehydrogenase [unclassified Pseudomonas]|uniref:zinc-binding dehydrogenase n=1 Tax=unclassified Pseudomonas TaxID=196821 RepID=UPI003FA3678B
MWGWLPWRLGGQWGSTSLLPPAPAARNQANYRQLFAWHAEDKLRTLVSQRYSLARAGDALEALRLCEVIGKLVVEI